ncbi:MAG: HNH endonuclease [Sphingomonas sp.]
MSDEGLRDALMRQAAVTAVEQRSASGILTATDLAAGFVFEGERLPLVNPQRGIFKPRQMRRLLSIKTVYPKPGGRVWYDDQRRAHAQIHAANELVDYSFMVGGADKAENQWLRDAMAECVPILYFLGVAPGRYTAIFPTFIADWSAEEQMARIAFGTPQMSALGIAEPSAPERRYALTLVRRRLHQASFREAVLAAYGGRCAISRLPEPRLLDAAHIVPDMHEDLGQPIVTNGLPLSKVHHAAYDANLIGVDPDYCVHISQQLLSIHDGPMLENIKQSGGKLLHLPPRSLDLPDRDRLAARFELFRAA